MEQIISIEPFLNAEGKITKLPQKRNARHAVLAYLAEKFEQDHTYTEREINAICDEWHTFGDYFLLRRELVESGLLARKRDCSQYWKAQATPQEADQPQPPEAPEPPTAENL